MSNNSPNALTFSPPSDYPLANTEAARMLAESFERTLADKGWSQRQIAKMLNYKTSVVLSHMALGRVPIPVDRALDFARLLSMDASKFLLAVMEQRHPDIDFVRVLGINATKGKGVAKGGRESYALQELEDLAGCPLDELPTDRMNVLRQVVSESNPDRRWVKPHEIAVLSAVRQRFPDGMSITGRKNLEEALDKLV